MGAVTSLRKLMRCQADALPQQARMRSSRANGVNLVTYDGLGSGVGEASALVADLLELAGVPTSRFQYRFHAPTEADHTYDPTQVGELHRSTIAALNAPDHLLASTIFPRVFAPSRHRIGVWHWEVDALPLPSPPGRGGDGRDMDHQRLPAGHPARRLPEACRGPPAPRPHRTFGSPARRRGSS